MSGELTTCKKFNSFSPKNLKKLNFEGRGFTVGDLTILIIVILCSLFIVNKFRESKNQKQLTNSYQLEILKTY